MSVLGDIGVSKEQIHDAIISLCIGSDLFLVRNKGVDFLVVEHQGTELMWVNLTELPMDCKIQLHGADVGEFLGKNFKIV